MNPVCILAVCTTVPGHGDVMMPEVTVQWWPLAMQEVGGVGGRMGGV